MRNRWYSRRARQGFQILGHGWIDSCCPLQAELASKESIAFMIKYTSGVLCCAVQSERAEVLLLVRVLQPMRGGLRESSVKRGAERFHIALPYPYPLSLYTELLRFCLVNLKAFLQQQLAVLSCGVLCCSFRSCPLNLLIRFSFHLAFLGRHWSYRRWWRRTRMLSARPSQYPLTCTSARASPPTSPRPVALCFV